MRRLWWFLWAFIFVISLVLDKFIVGFFEESRIPSLNDFITTFSIFASGWFSLIVVGLLILYYKRKLIFRFLIAFGIVGIVTYLIKIAIRRVRPFTILDIASLIPDKTGFSFPSGHVLFAFFCLGFIWKDFKKFRYIWLVIAVLIGFSRLYVGVHYLSDVIGGALIGWFFGILFKKIRLLNF